MLNAYQTRTTTGSLKRSSNHHSFSSDDDDGGGGGEDERSADPDFLALSKRQRRAVDAAFRKGLRDVRRKRRKVVTPVDGSGGGFIDGDSGGGGGGGFVVDDEPGGTGGGGFLASPSPPPTTTITAITTGNTGTAHHSPPTDDFLPYSALPAVFASLGLQWDDDVLATLKGLSAASRAPQQAGEAGEAGAGAGAGARPDETSWGMDDNYVDLHDFRSVCGVLMQPEEEGAGAGADVAGADSEMKDVNDDDDDEEEYAEDEDMDTSSDQSDPDQPKGTDTRRRRRTRKPRKPSPTSEVDDLRLPGNTSSTTPAQRKLSREEKEWVSRMWDTLFTGTTLGRGESSRLLGKEQVKSWAEKLGMEWSDQELTEMIELFSTQPGKRGLGFDDFCNLLIQGGML
ncbi:hypothetical protein QFC22_001682 [Naganishia vaughanmartiniae]|uniref:Uncharacterized protein n=1 Tax=Naganishia vaughanmartiniae TaxID=1424756 RepID=A0ACC2XG76_9TREE|nr:hypothetical protein QFC22_001682 [Naganishia vaughanmartiniae]